jgi:hypothetical protein
LTEIKSKGGNNNYLFGNCGEKPGEDIIEGKFKKVVLRCPNYNLYNYI